MHAPLPYDSFVAALERSGYAVRERRADQCRAQCPGHNGSDCNLAVTRGAGNSALVYCHSHGCTWDQINEGLGTPRQNPPVSQRGNGSATGHGAIENLGEPVAVYRYNDAQGNLVFEQLRYRLADGKKTFRVRCLDSAGGWVYRKPSGDLPLYHLPQLLAADPKEPVYLCNGEKAVLVLEKAGLVATCNPLGEAQKWSDHPHWIAPLRGRRCVALIDNDNQGWRHCVELERAMAAAKVSCAMVELPDLPSGGDVVDWLAAGHNASELRAFVPQPRAIVPSLSPVAPAATPDRWGTLEKVMKTEFAAVKWVVPGLIPEGLTIMAGRPKIGKSYGLLGLALAVASGGRAFSQIPVEAGDALLLALEDSERRLQDRIRPLLTEGCNLKRVDVATTWPLLLAAGEMPRQGRPDCVGELKRWLDQRPEARLIVIDTLARILPRSSQQGNAYAVETSLLAPLHRLAIDRHVALVLATHLRKAPTGRAPLDVFNEITGTMAISGVADTLMVLTKGKEAGELRLCVRGRDLGADEQYTIAWDKDTSAWNLLGKESEGVRSALHKAILAALKAQGVACGVKYVAELLGRGDDQGIAVVRTTMSRMAKEESLLSISPGVYLASE